MKWFSVGWLILLIIAFYYSCGPKKEAKKIDAKALVAQKCSICHAADRINNKPRSQREWAIVVKRMRIINPRLLTPEEASLMTRYFQENLSK